MNVNKKDIEREIKKLNAATVEKLQAENGKHNDKIKQILEQLEAVNKSKTQHKTK